jgi:CRISPR system Cascade subunit CasB
MSQSEPLPADTTEPRAGKPTQSRALKAAIWWAALQRTHPDGTPNPTADPGALARLRRSATPGEALAERATIALCRELGCRADDNIVESVAVLAIVLAHVREDRRGQKLGQCLGPNSENGDTPLLSELRLRRLLAARDGAELLRGFREVVALLGDRAPVLDLATLMLGWLDDERGERLRTRFLFDYHGASDAAPPDTDEPAAA